MPEKKYIIAVLTTIVILMISACSTRTTPIPYSPYTEQVATVLDTSGDNRHEIESFLNSYPGNPEKRQAAHFLIANLPQADRATLSADLLRENLEYAFLARETTKWGKDVPWSEFLHYVLPHRVSQEQAVCWRKIFYTELLPVVSRCRTMEEAVLAVNRWCFSKTGFQSTQRWDQDPLMTVNRGWGRCEEAVILTVSALRSVGIPARQSMVPAWQHSNDNHTWTEVLLNGKWNYIESANPDYGPGHAWFTGSARKAPLVLSYAYGQVARPHYPVQGRPFGCTVINTTSLYAPSGRMEVLVTDEEGKPQSGIKVYASVFNYASFRPVAAAITGEDGKTGFTLGPGSVLLSAAKDNSTAYAASSWLPDKTEKRADCVLKLTPGNLPEGEVFFPFHYNDSLALTAPPKNSEGSKKAEFESIKEARKQLFEGMKEAAVIFDAELAAKISQAGLNVPQILKAFESCPADDRATLEKSVSQMQVADLIKIKAPELIENARLAAKARKEAEAAGIIYDDETFASFVLSPRIMYEQLLPWREALHNKFRITAKKGLSGTLHTLGSFCRDLKVTPGSPLGDRTPPLGVLKGKTVSREYETGIFAAAAFRAAGIPARYLDEQEWVEYFDGESWLPFFPRSPELSGNRNATAESRAYYGKWPTAFFKIPGFPRGSKPPQYFRDFTLSKLKDGNRFIIIEKSISGKLNQDDNIWEISSPIRDIYIICAKRNENNEPDIQIIKLKRLIPGSR